MLKKSFITVLFVAVCLIAATGISQATQVDGMRSSLSTAAALPATLHVHVNPGGLGDALIYGYYNARGNYNFIRVVNTSQTTGVSAKVRFREGKNSNELLDFYICLSAGDQWSAWIIGDTNTATPATLYWYDDDTPTYPDPQSNNVATDNMMATVQLRYASSGAASSVTADDTKEGYFEIIANNSWIDVPGSSKVVKTPNDCGYVSLVAGENPSNDTAAVLTSATGATNPRTTLDDTPNVLFGNAYIFDLTASTYGTYAYNASALANFRASGILGSLGVDSIPTLSNSQDTIAGVNYSLTKAAEFATYEIESGFTGGTTIVNTFPTKRRSLVDSSCSGLSAACASGVLVGGSQNGPFNDAAYITSAGVISDTTTSGRCETVTVQIWDDAENTPGSTSAFSPSTPVTRSKCDEVSLLVVSTAGTSLLSSNLVAFNIDASSFGLGWVQETFSAAAGVYAATARMTRFPGAGGAGSQMTWGLPVISYELQNLASTLSHMLPLRYITLVN